MPTNAQRSSGFALPSLLVVSVVMLSIAMVSLAAIMSIRASLENQYYGKMAIMAAESGINHAVYCLKENNYAAQWTTSSKLRPGTSCTGGNECDTGPNCFVVYDPTRHLRTTYEVDGPTASIATQELKIKGRVDLLRASSGRVWRSYERQKSAKLNKEVDIQKIGFGYTTQGAYFATISSDGITRSVGDNTFGQLGTGDVTPSALPREYKIPSGRAERIFTNFLSLGNNMFVLSDNGVLYGSGRNKYGQLGNGRGGISYDLETTPVKFGSIDGQKAILVATQGSSTFVVTDQYRMYSAGRCSAGMLGIGCSDTEGEHSTPAEVTGLPDEADPANWPVEMVTDSGTVYVRLAGGKVFGWGSNKYGQLIGGTVTSFAAYPKQLGTFGNPGEPTAEEIDFDGNTIYIRDSNGEVWATGRNHKGQMAQPVDTSGNLEMQNIRALTKIVLPVGEGKVVQVSTDQWYVVLRTEAGNVWSVGINGMGQLGAGTGTVYESTVQKFILPPGVKAEAIYSCSLGDYSPNSATYISNHYNNTFVVGDNGAVYGAGSNLFGQLGNGTVTEYEATPVRMNVFGLDPVTGKGIRAHDVRCGFGTTIIITQAPGSKVYTVGNNKNGQLGDGSTNNSSVPYANRYTNVFPTLFY